MKNITVIIPVFNEEKFLPGIFESLKNQDYPKKLTQIIIVDGNSTDNSIKILKEYMGKLPNLTVLTNQARIVPISMNIGIKQAKGDYIIRLDSHSKYNNDYFTRCVEYLEKTGSDCVGGPIRLTGDLPVQKAIMMATTCSFGIGNSSFHFDNYEGFVESVYLGAFRKEVFTKYGLFDEELVRNQDDELNYRILKGGGKIFLTPQIKSYYYPRASLSKLWKQYYEYGYWKVKVIQKHKMPSSIRHLIPGTFVLSIASGLIASLYKGIGLYLLIPVLVSYLTALSFFTSHQAVKHGFNNILLLALVFCILHFSYGTGFLKGIVDFYIIGTNKENI